MNDSIDSKAKNQLLIIEKNLNYFHYIFLVLFFIVFFITFILANQMWIFKNVPVFQQNEEGLEQVLKHEYENAIYYLQYVERMAHHINQNQQAFSSYNLNDTSTLEELQQKHSTKVYGISCGMECIIGSCQTLSPLKNILWQYIKFTKIIHSVVVCRNTSECVGVPLLGLSSVDMNSLQFEENKILVQKYQNMIVFTKESDDLRIVMKLNVDISGFMPDMSDPLCSISVSDSLNAINYTKTNNLNKNNSEITTQLINVQIQNENYVLFNIFIRKVYIINNIINALSLLLLLPLLFGLSLFYLFRKGTRQWLQNVFERKNLVNNLYKFSLNQIFTGKKPVESLVVGKGPMNEFYRLLSELPDKSIQPIYEKEENKRPGQAFKFCQIIDQIVENYRSFQAKSMQTKNRQILNNRFNLQSYINEMCENENKQIKDYFSRVQELDLIEQFFKFAYEAILKEPVSYEYFLTEDATAIPEKLVKFFVELNQKIHRTDIIRQRIQRIDEKSQQQQRKEETDENKREIQTRIKIILLPKYLAMLKDLDIHNYYAKKLSYERELWSLSEKIENMRYLLTRHNKNIRMFGK